MVGLDSARRAVHSRDVSDGSRRESPCKADRRRPGRVLALSAFSLLIASGAVAGCSTFPRDERAEWILVSSSPESSIVKVRAGFGGCSSYLRTDVKETTGSVNVVVIVHTVGDDCKAILNTKDVEVMLKAPLGRRKIVGECEGPAGGICFGMRASLPTTSS